MKSNIHHNLRVQPFIILAFLGTKLNFLLDREIQMEEYSHEIEQYKQT